MYFITVDEGTTIMSLIHWNCHYVCVFLSMDFPFLPSGLQYLWNRTSLGPRFGFSFTGPFNLASHSRSFRLLFQHKEPTILKWLARLPVPLQSWKYSFGMLISSHYIHITIIYGPDPNVRVPLHFITIESLTDVIVHQQCQDFQDPMQWKMTFSSCYHAPACILQLCTNTHQNIDKITFSLIWKFSFIFSWKAATFGADLSCIWGCTLKQIIQWIMSNFRIIATPLNVVLTIHMVTPLFDDFTDSDIFCVPDPFSESKK